MFRFTSWEAIDAQWNHEPNANPGQDVLNVRQLPHKRARAGRLGLGGHSVSPEPQWRPTDTGYSKEHHTRLQFRSAGIQGFTKQERNTKNKREDYNDVGHKFNGPNFPGHKLQWLSDIVTQLFPSGFMLGVCCLDDV